MTHLEPPRWPGGPGICPVANLPGFLAVEDLTRFVDSLCGSVMVKWQCSECGTWHFWPSANPNAPAGETSGSCRAYAIPARIIDLIRQTKIRA